MLAKKNRLTKQKDIELVYKKGKTLANRYFRIKYKLNKVEESRGTVIVSQKVAKSAVKRNSLKRMVRPILSKTLGKYRKSLDVMFIVQAASVKLSRKEFIEQASQIFKKLLNG